MKGKEDSVEGKHIMHHLNSESLSTIVTCNENVIHASEQHGCTWIYIKIRISLLLHYWKPFLQELEHKDLMPYNWSNHTTNYGMESGLLQVLMYEGKSKSLCPYFFRPKY
jgi:hypothetical protein